MASSESLLLVSSQQDSFSDSSSNSISETVRRRPIKVYFAVCSGFLLVALYVAFVVTDGSTPKNGTNDETMAETRARLAGVSEKRVWNVFDDRNGEAFAWNNTMLSWQRTAFHFQPEKNWMNGI
ncbi:hypothetical protein Rs2_46375 [Raphanus sativus]|nr:hypothetical protein Rs2_51875 [Raphanus sativus]KAJ4871980.1 hypothetical protein Rs2_46375 [Raphanus sativus]